LSLALITAPFEIASDEPAGGVQFAERPGARIKGSSPLASGETSAPMSKTKKMTDALGRAGTLRNR
jgi:hypothetical protein